MRVTVDGHDVEGRAVDLTAAAVGASAVLGAIRGSEADGSAVAVECPDPGPVHDHVGRLPPASFDRRGALAAAARGLGHESDASDRLAAAREELASLSTPAVDLRSARRRVAEAGAEEERLRERVAELRGRLRARRETGADVEAVRAELSDAVARLSEVETERIAAEQALERAEADARDARDCRERRLELEDRAANLERTVRADLAAAVWDRFRGALDAVPGAATAGDTPGTYDGDDATAALAIARLSPLDAPVVVDGLGRLDGAEDARAVVDAPVIYIG